MDLTPDGALGVIDMFKYLKEKFGKKKPVTEEKLKREKKKLSPKEEATTQGQPYVTVISMEIDPSDPSQGAFELDWNDIFVAKLVRAGYQGKTDQDIVDNWFKNICRNIVLETYEQEMADPDVRRSNQRNLGNGRTEVS